MTSEEPLWELQETPSELSRQLAEAAAANDAADAGPETKTSAGLSARTTPPPKEKTTMASAAPDPADVAAASEIWKEQPAFAEAIAAKVRSEAKKKREAKATAKEEAPASGRKKREPKKREPKKREPKKREPKKREPKKKEDKAMATTDKPARKPRARKPKTEAAPAAPAAVVVVTEPKKPTRRKGKGKGKGGKGGGAGALVKGGSSTTNMLVDGALVIGGAAAAVKIDEMIAARPGGFTPSAIGTVASIATAVVASRYKRPRLARAAGLIGVGMATGIVARAASSSGGGKATTPTV